MKKLLLLAIALGIALGILSGPLNASTLKSVPADQVLAKGQGSAPGTPDSGYYSFYYLSSDGFPYWKNSSGTIFGYMYAASAITQYGVMLGAGTRSPTVLAPNASTAFPLVSGGASANPVWALLSVAGGGTGLATLTAHALYVGNGTSAPTALAVGANNTVLVGNTDADPSYRTIVNADVNASAAIALSKLASGNNYGWITGNSSGVPTSQSALTGSRAVVTDSNGLPAVSATTATQIGYVDFTSSGQTQMDTKMPKSGGTFTDAVTFDEVKETVVAGGTCSTSYNVDPRTGTKFTLTLSGACQLGVTGLAAGHSFTVKLTQSSTTAPTFTSAYKWAGGTSPVFSSSATKYDKIACDSDDGSTLICGAIIDAR